MNLALEAFLAIMSLIGCGFFACYAYKTETIVEDRITKTMKRDMHNQYIYGFFSFITGISGISLLLDALKLI